ncbi:hypothetical protein [Halobacillus sp. A1]|uniref:hypothetical protein n=1 Tax=Halobacillus sp. A1 TaxID=2880262 RepID=UPI0020A64C95|nr:hypothetical protein [Halobacillus sp. A1]
MGCWKWIAFRGDDGQPFPQESHHFQHPITLIRAMKPSVIEPGQFREFLKHQGAAGRR